MRAVRGLDQTALRLIVVAPLGIDSYGVALQVRQNGDLHVTEKITYHFGGSDGLGVGGQEHHGIVRTIPLRRHVDAGHDRVIEIRNPRVHGTGFNPGDLDVTTSGDKTVLKIGTPNTTVSGVKTYVIDYDVPQVLVPRGDNDELYWNAVGTQWRVPIHAVTVSVSTPVSIASAQCYQGLEGMTSDCAGAPVAGSRTTFTESALTEGEGGLGQDRTAEGRNERHATAVRAASDALRADGAGWRPLVGGRRDFRRVRLVVHAASDPAAASGGGGCASCRDQSRARRSAPSGRTGHRSSSDGAGDLWGCAGPRVPLGIYPGCGVCEDPRRLRRAHFPTGRTPTEAEERWKPIWQRRLPPVARSLQAAAYLGELDNSTALDEGWSRLA